MNQFSTLALTLAIGLAAASSASANDAHHGAASTPATQVAQASAPLSDGEVKKVDKSAAKITIKHGPLAKLDMPGMTMVFRVKDPAMLDQVKAGDKIRFEADKVNGAFTVMKLETAKAK